MVLTTGQVAIIAVVGTLLGSYLQSRYSARQLREERAQDRLRRQHEDAQRDAERRHTAYMRRLQLDHEMADSWRDHRYSRHATFLSATRRLEQALFGLESFTEVRFADVRKEILQSCGRLAMEIHVAAADLELLASPPTVARVFEVEEYATQCAAFAIGMDMEQNPATRAGLEIVSVTDARMELKIKIDLYVDAARQELGTAIGTGTDRPAQADGQEPEECA